MAKRAKKDLKKIKHSKFRKSFESIYETLKKDPYEKSQSFEKLQPFEKNRYSRRINHQHRVIYKVDEENKIVKIYSAWSHYE